MKPWIQATALAAAVAASGWVGWSAMHADAGEKQPPRQISGPALGYVSVPRNRGNWAATGSTAEETARQFALPGGQCDCKQVVVKTEGQVSDSTAVRVDLLGLYDDSVLNQTYVVTVKRTGDQWVVVGAQYKVDCRRGVTPEGLCV